MQYDQGLVELFQDYCKHYESVFHISPLTAQIYTYIMFNGHRDGITFDEIVEKLNASKSSVSNSLNLLISNNQIEHFNRIDERKRFFRLNPNFMMMRLEIIRDFLEKEQSLTSKLKQYMDNQELETFSCLHKMDIYLEHLEKSKAQLTKTIEKLKGQI